MLTELNLMGLGVGGRLCQIVLGGSEKIQFTS